MEVLIKGTAAEIKELFGDVATDEEIAEKIRETEDMTAPMRLQEQTKMKFLNSVADAVAVLFLDGTEG